MGMKSNLCHTSQIGVFDSGVGGLTVMQQLMKTLPNESIIYFGDTARVPYGGKSRDTVIRYCIENTIFLMEQNIKLLVIACNTADALAISKLRQIFNIPIVGVIEPGAERAAQTTISKRLAVLGTKGTIRSGAYQEEILRLLPEAHVIAQACPLFVPLVEEHYLHHGATKLIIKEYLTPLKHHQIDTILLGCTHYPILKHLIQEEMGPTIKLVDSASSCAEKVAAMLKQYHLESTQSEATYKYHVTDDAQKFSEIAHTVFGQPITHVEHVRPGERWL